ncbi:MAG: hypothetical protein Q9227_000264 [Pyrenula ochraceoflavens]
MGVTVNVSFYEPEMKNGFKHWAVYIHRDTNDGATEQHIIAQINGSSGRWTREVRHGEPAISKKHIKDDPFFTVDDSYARTLVKIAQSVEPRNDKPAYNCQDFTLNVLQAFGEQLEFSDEARANFENHCEHLAETMDGLVPVGEA